MPSANNISSSRKILIKVLQSLLRKESFQYPLEDIALSLDINMFLF